LSELLLVTVINLVLPINSWLTPTELEWGCEVRYSLDSGMTSLTSAHMNTQK